MVRISKCRRYVTDVTRTGSALFGVVRGVQYFGEFSVLLDVLG